MKTATIRQWKTVSGTLQIDTLRERRIDTLKTRFPSKNPNKKAAAETKFSRDLALHVCENIVDRKPGKAAAWIRTKVLPALPMESGWFLELYKLASMLDTLETRTEDSRGLPIFAPGNKKLSFVAFSVLPAFTCPGAGACLAFCYSFTAWRYPAALCRQILNTVLMRYRRDIVANAFNQIPNGATVRLYVDGDFENAGQLEFWFRLLTFRPDLAAYGYSKSWGEFVEYAERGGEFPTNYSLNLSSGSLHGEDMKTAVSALRNVEGLPVVRGEFVAVPIPRSKDIPRGSARYDSPAYHAAVRKSAEQIFGRKAFSCPGQCDDCRKDKHACGETAAEFPVLIAIGIH